MSQPTRLRLLRHGESTANAANRFEGGAPDKPGRPTRLTRHGAKQGFASGAAARNAGIVVARVTTSRMHRAIHTGHMSVRGYGEGASLHHLRLDDAHEIDHGSLQDAGVTKQCAAEIRQEVVARYTNELLDAGLHPGLIEIASWVIGTGNRNGESYLDAARRAHRTIAAHDHQENEVLVGHNGTWRQLRALGMFVTGADREQLFGAMDEADRAGNRLQADIGLIALLEELGLPPLDYINDESKRIGNAELVTVSIDSVTGIWTPESRLIPILPSGDRTPLTRETVGFNLLPFNGPDEWI